MVLHNSCLSARLNSLNPMNGFQKKISTRKIYNIFVFRLELRVDISIIGITKVLIRFYRIQWSLRK